MITKQGAGNNYYSKSSSIGSRTGGEALFEAKGYYVATGGETSIFAVNLIGDTISWNSNDFTKVEVLRSTGGKLIPRWPGMPSTGWGVDLTSPGIISFSNALQVGEIVYVTNREQRQTIIRPEYPNFATTYHTISATSSQVSWNLSRPGKLTWKNGENRGQSVIVILDGKPQRPNFPGTTDGDYTEVSDGNGDTFSTITFNVIPSSPSVDINLTIDHKGFYDGDNISTQQLINLQNDFNTTGRLLQKVEKVVTGSTSLGTTVIPGDTTIPQISEGNAITGFDTTFTPRSITSEIIITAQISSLSYSSSSIAGYMIAALFINGGANSVRTNYCYETDNRGINLHLLYKFLPGSLSPIVINARAGGSAAGTFIINGNAGVTLGDTISSWMIIEEVIQ